MYSKSKPLKN